LELSHWLQNFIRSSLVILGGIISIIYSSIFHKMSIRKDKTMNEKHQTYF